MSHFALVLDQSRKSKASRNVYDHLRAKVKNRNQLVELIEFEQATGTDGIRVDSADKYRLLNVRLHDEYLSPYFKTNMNLFQLLMIDESVEMLVFRSDKGWMFVFEGLAPGPQPFGQNGFDMR